MNFFNQQRQIIATYQAILVMLESAGKVDIIRSDLRQSRITAEKMKRTISRVLHTLYDEDYITKPITETIQHIQICDSLLTVRHLSKFCLRGCRFKMIITVDEDCAIPEDLRSFHNTIHIFNAFNGGITLIKVKS